MTDVPEPDVPQPAQVDRVPAARPAPAAGAEAGSAVPELVAGVALLLAPVAVLMAMLPVWSQVQAMGRVAARQAARAAVLEPTSGVARAAAQRAAASAAADHGRALAAPVRIEEVRSGDGQRLVTATVVVTLPALTVPLVGELGALEWSASSTQAVDLYRSGRW